MSFQTITKDQKDVFNSFVSHPLQSFQWGEFREKTGIRVIRKGSFENEKLIDAFQLTIHKIPKTPWTIGYLPKGTLPTQILEEELLQVGKQERSLFMQLEPNIVKGQAENIENNSFLRRAIRPLFTKYTFLLSLTKSEDELLAKMHPKTRYNIRVAQKHGVEIVEDNSDKAFAEYLRLTEETTKRQGFYAHTKKYHTLMWETLAKKNGTLIKKDLTAHLFLAKYKGETLTAWIVFVFHDTLYYPYGASSSSHRDAMASNLMMWEVIRFGKNLGLTNFDMWGALGPNPDKNDPWYGFHRFKEGYGPTLTEFMGSFDLVVQPLLYKGYSVADFARWSLLRLKTKLS